MKALFMITIALGFLSTAQAKQVGESNVSNEKMCVCEPCGGKMVPCRDTENEYVKQDVKPQPNATEGKTNSAQDNP